jgi:hypothetical protein
MSDDPLCPSPLPLVRILAYGRRALKSMPLLFFYYLEDGGRRMLRNFYLPEYTVS